MSIKPRLSRLDLTMIVISLVIGMGIFATPSDTAREVGNEWVFLGAWVFGGVVSLCGALTFAEIGSRYPVAGGFYRVYSYCYHPAFAFMINWVLVISNAASVAAVALIGSDYIKPFLLPASLQNETGTHIITIVSTLILYVINFMGIKMSARTQNFLISFKIGLILLVCIAVFKSDAYPAPMAVTVPHHNLLAGLGLCLVPVFFTYGGYQQTINFGGDIVNPKSNIPKSIAVGIGVIIFLYVAINFAYLKVLGLGGLQHTPALAAKMLGVLFGSAGYKIMSVLLFFGVLAFVNVNVLSNPRVYYAMAEDGILPPIFHKVNPKTQVQEFGMSIFVALTLLVLFFVDSFSKLVESVMFFDTIGLSLAALTIFILRKKMKNEDTSEIYTIKWFPLVPLIFIISYWFVTINIVVDFKEHLYEGLICVGCYAFGLIVYYICVGNKKKVLPE